MKFKYLRTFLTAIALWFAALGVEAQTLSPQVSLVTKLYEDFAFEAVIDSPDLTRLDFVASPRDKLLMYLTPEVTALLLRNRRWEAKTKELSSLDFGPLWGSSDPNGMSVIILKTNKPDVVEVQITRNMGTGQEPNTRSIFYVLKPSKVGWRVDDILYPGLAEGYTVTFRHSLITN